MSSFSIGQMNQLGDALERAGFTPGDVTRLGQYVNLRGIKNLLGGLSELNQKVHLIDCDADPLIPYEGWKVEEHDKGGGQMAFNPTKVGLHLSPDQKSIVGNNLRKLRKELKSEVVLNANVLDYLLKNPHLIPEEWKRDENGNTRYVFFWGTIYRNSGGVLCVRYLFWDGDWQAGISWLGRDWVAIGPAAVLVS